MGCGSQTMFLRTPGFLGASSRDSTLVCAVLCLYVGFGESFLLLKKDLKTASGWILFVVPAHTNHESSASDHGRHVAFFVAESRVRTQTLSTSCFPGEKPVQQQWPLHRPSRCGQALPRRRGDAPTGHLLRAVCPERGLWRARVPRLAPRQPGRGKGWGRLSRPVHLQTGQRGAEQALHLPLSFFSSRLAFGWLAAGTQLREHDHPLRLVEGLPLI